jgi:glyoxylase-like metal-dependent hydrolase (beta-lactamase superfamily II)
MKTIRHGENLVQLTRLGAVNAYLVREVDGLTLVDTTIGGSAKGILAAARALDSAIVRIALTHAHGDHVGSLDELHDVLSGAEVLIGAREARLLDKDKSLDPGEPRAKIRGSLPGTRTKPTRTLVPGDRVGSLEVHAAPGHTPGHIAFFDARDGTLIAGDAFQTLGGIAVAGVVRPLFPFPAMGTWHKPTAAETGARLAALQPSRLATGHGKVLDQPGRAMADAVAAAR